MVTVLEAWSHSANRMRLGLLAISLVAALAPFGFVQPSVAASSDFACLLFAPSCAVVLSGKGATDAAADAARRNAEAQASCNGTPQLGTRTTQPMQGGCTEICWQCITGQRCAEARGEASPGTLALAHAFASSRSHIKRVEKSARKGL
jgi:hypothetical protein